VNDDVLTLDGLRRRRADLLADFEAGTSLLDHVGLLPTPEHVEQLAAIIAAGRAAAAGLTGEVSQPRLVG
jgi:hypothetical protein